MLAVFTFILNLTVALIYSETRKLELSFLGTLDLNKLY